MLTALLIATSMSAQAPPKHRNIFAFEREPVVVVAPIAPRAIATKPAPLVIAAPAVAPQAPKFTWRYIGRFGPDANPIAAFTRDGEVLIAHAGDTIDTGFVLRGIGVESVQVGLIGGELQTIGIGQ